MTCRTRLRRPPERLMQPVDFEALSKDTDTMKVERKITKRLPDLSSYSYEDFVIACNSAHAKFLPTKRRRMLAKSWVDADIVRGRKEVRTKRQLMRQWQTPGRVKDGTDAAPELADLYVAKMNGYYAGVAGDIENCCHEAKPRAACDALNVLIGRKTRVHCGVVASSKAERPKLLRSHFEELLSGSTSLMEFPVQPTPTCDLLVKV